jgi:adenosylmethionine-8-amino-7-oxononanoate aminotransferase
MSAVTFAGTSVASGPMPKVAWGRGVEVFDTDGRRYLDGSGGPAVYCLGHGNAEVNAAITAQLERIAHGYRYTFTSDPLEALTAIVAGHCGGDLTRMVFVSGGSEAVESALKIALQVHTARGEPRRRRFVARQRSWHGNTLGALSISGFAERRAPYEGALIPASFVSPANAYRPPEGVPPDALASWYAAELEAELLRVGPETVAAFVFEPVVGAAGGVVPAPPGYASAIAEVCRRYGVLVIADEVMCGSGRCGTWRALAHDSVEPDIMTVAKGLAGGYLPLGAAVYSRAIGADLDRVHGGPMTGHTFTGHTACCAAGVAVQTVVARDRLVDRVRELGPRFMSMIARETRGLDAVGDIRGRGFFVGVELVADRATRVPFPASDQLYLRIRRHAFERGLICYPSGGNVDGVAGDTVILSPPYIATEAELEEIAALFGASLRAALAEVGAG